MSDQNNETPLEQAQEQREEQAENSPLDQVRERQESQQQALADKEEQAQNHRPPPEVNPAGNPIEHPSRKIG